MNLKQRKRNWPLYYEITKPTRFDPGGLKTYWPDEWEALQKSHQPADGPARRFSLILLISGGEAKKRPIATHDNSGFALTHSKQRISQFLIATHNVFPFRFLFALRESCPELTERIEELAPSAAASFASRIGLRDEGLPHGRCSLTLLRRHSARRRSYTGITYREAVAWRLKK